MCMSGLTLHSPTHLPQPQGPYELQNQATKTCLPLTYCRPQGLASNGPSTVGISGVQEKWACLGRYMQIPKTSLGLSKPVP